MPTPTTRARYLRAWLNEAGMEAVLDALLAQIPAEAHTPVPWEAPLDLKRWRAAYKALDHARTEIRCYRPPEKDSRADIAHYLREYPEDEPEARRLHFSEDSVMGTSVESSHVLHRFQYWRDHGRRPRPVQEAIDAAMNVDGATGAHFLEWLFEVTAMLPHQLSRAHVPRLIDEKINAARRYGLQPHVLVQDFTQWLINQRPDLVPAIREAQERYNGPEA